MLCLCELGYWTTSVAYVRLKNLQTLTWDGLGIFDPSFVQNVVLGQLLTCDPVNIQESILKWILPCNTGVH